MGIYTDESEILGLRILTEEPLNSGDYYLKYEFTDRNWRLKSMHILPQFLGKSNVKIQTLHPFSTSHNLQTGYIANLGNLWLDNYYFKI